MCHLVPCELYPPLVLDVCPPTPVAPVWLLCQGAPRWLQQVMQQDTRTAGISSLTRLQKDWLVQLAGSKCAPWLVV